MPTSDTPPDKSYDDLVGRYQAGQIGRDEFFSRLFDEYYSTLVVYGRRLGLSPDESRDLAQDSFVRIHRYLDQLDPRSSLRAYLLTTFRNLTLNHIRARHSAKRSGVIVSDDELLEVQAADAAIDDTLIAKAQLDQLREAMATALTPDDAALLMSHYVEERSYSDMAETLGVSVSVLHFRIRRALMKLQRYLKDRELAKGKPNG